MSLCQIADRFFPLNFWANVEEKLEILEPAKHIHGRMQEMDCEYRVSICESKQLKTLKCYKNTFKELVNNSESNYFLIGFDDNVTGNIVEKKSELQNIQNKLWKPSGFGDPQLVSMSGNNK